MAQHGWSSLPADLVNRVADCLLGTNDLDCYMDLHAVCQNWRSATVDPRSNQHDPRFRPTRWVTLVELEHRVRSDDAFLFVNATTGRFVRKRLAPLFRDYGFVTTSTGMVGSSPTLVLAAVSTGMVYWADPQSESFSVEKHDSCPASRLPLIAAGGRGYDAGANNIFSLIQPREREGCRCYVVEAGAGGEMLAVLKRLNGIAVFRLDSAGNVLERVRSFGTRALFLGIRCLAVDADRFPAIEPNCAYFRLTNRGDVIPTLERDIYKFDIDQVDDAEAESEWVSPAMGDGAVWDYNVRPFTLTQLLCSYTMDIPCRPLTWEGCSLQVQGSPPHVDGFSGTVDCYEDCISCIDDSFVDQFGEEEDISQFE